jgi:ATP phosphoribosyltransferase
MSSLLHCLYAVGKGNMKEVRSEGLKSREGGIKKLSSSSQNSALWLALPDGHQQKPTLEFLRKAGIRVEDQFAESRRPTTSLEGVKVKVIRPQDMPLQVANKNFDLAITGKDWLYDHLYRFPSSPVKEIMDLGFGKVRVVAVVSNELPVDSPQDLRELLGRDSLTILRVASEYTNLADKYARDNHLSPYRLIPTWGASEAFLPEDADLLIENVQTGRTLAQHNLKIIDTIFESSACLIGNAYTPDSSKQERMDYVIQTLYRAAKEN